MTKFSLWKISLLTIVCTQLTWVKYQVLKIFRMFFYFSANKHLTTWVFLWPGLFLLTTSYMVLQKTLKVPNAQYLMSLFLWRQWFTFAPTFCGKLAPKSSTTLPFCPLHPLEEDFPQCYFQGTGRWTFIQWIQVPGNWKDLHHSNILVRNHVFNFSGIKKQQGKRVTWLINGRQFIWKSHSISSPSSWCSV